MSAVQAETPDADGLAATIAELCELPGPTGREEAVRARLAERWRPHVDTLAVDGVGNLLAKVGGQGRRTLLTAHMDEIGFVVRHVTDAGFLLVANAQSSGRVSHERRYMVGQPAQVLGRDGVVARGVFAAPSGHVLTAAQLAEPRLTAADFFVDVGADSREQALALGVHVGAPVVWDVPTRRLGDKLVGKAMDDRLLLAVLTALLERIDRDALGVELWVAATVQEENVCHGARALAARERFDQVVALDVGLCGDVPGVGPEVTDVRLGGGPVLVHSDFMAHYDHALTWTLADLAGRSGIAFQHGQFGDYGSDGLPFVDAGTPTALVAAPVRYTHTAFETAAVGDAAATVALVETFVTDRSEPDA